MINSVSVFNYPQVEKNLQCDELAIFCELWKETLANFNYNIPLFVKSNKFVCEISHIYNFSFWKQTKFLSRDQAKKKLFHDDNFRSQVFNQIRCGNWIRFVHNK